MSLVNSIINAVLAAAKLVGSGQSFSTVILAVIGQLPKLISETITFWSLDDEDKLDEALAEADKRLGSEIGALDIIHDLPDDKEEELTDAMLTIVRILAKSKLGIEGYIRDPNKDDTED